MGLLSRFPGLLQGWGAFDPFGQQQQNPLAPTPFFPQQPQEAGNLPTPPFVLNANAQQQQQGQPQQGGFMQRMQGMFDNPALQLGVSLLGHARGSDWAGVGQDMQGFSQQRMLKQRMDNEERRAAAQEGRESTAFGRQQTQWGNEDQQRRDWEAAIQRETDPVRQAQLRAIGPQGYGNFIAQEQQQRFQHNEGELDRNANLRAAQVRSANENSLGRYFQSMDAETLGTWNGQAAQLQAVGLPQLRALRQTIAQAGEGLVGQPIDYNSRITLGRLFNGSSSDRQTLEVWRAQILGPALETLRGLGAMSEREMEAAINSFSNPNMTLGAATQLIDAKIAEAERRVATAQAAGRFFNEAHGITGVYNAQGQDWPTYLQTQLGAPGGAPPQGAPGAQAPPQAARPPSGFRPQPSANDLQLLRSNSSAERRRQFDEIYGPGAAARALGGTNATVQGHGGASRPIF